MSSGLVSRLLRLTPLGSRAIRSTRHSRLARQLFAQHQYRRCSAPATARLTRENLSPAVVRAEYAVRGAIVIRAGQIEAEIKAKSAPKRSYDKVIMCNIGNPQSLEQTPLSYVRNVIAGVMQPTLLESGVLPTDVCQRSKAILKGTASMSIGAYTHSQGLSLIRQSVAEFITNRDGTGVDCNPDHLFLTDGASPGIKAVLQCLVSSPNHGVLLPIPQYPLYSASISLLGGSQLNYYLDEDSGWSFNPRSVEESIKDAKSNGIDPRAMVVINPGNPTGQCLSEESIAEAIEIAKREKLVILADEVYQENIYDPSQPFHSFRKVLQSMGPSYSSVELASFHSVSKGIMGECGLRGGYMELLNVPASGVEEMYKLMSISLCSNTCGQVTVDTMVRPPKEGDESYPQYRQEYDNLFSSLQRRASMLSKALNSIGPTMSSQQIKGAMYAFPQISLPKKLCDAASEKGLAPDAFYCLNLLEEAGICVVPGSGFGQRDGSYHFRTTLLPPEKDIQSVVDRLASFHNAFIDRYS